MRFLNNPQLTAPGSTPAAADESSLVIYPTSLAERYMLAMQGPTGLATVLQPNIFSNSIMMFAPQSGTVGTGSNSFQTSWTSNGTVTHSALNPSIFAACGRNTTYANVASTTNQQLGPRMNTAAERCFFRGAISNTGGFFYYSRFRPVLLTSTSRLFTGLQGNSATASICISDAPAGPYCGLQHISTDPASGAGSLNFVTHDGTTRNALPITPFSNLVNDTPLLDFMMYCPPMGGTIYFRLVELAFNIPYINSTTANLPAATALMSPQCQVSNGASNTTVNTVNISVNKIYVESII
jgi:hypothetical protein